jgi:hypothetical protein
MAASAFLAAPFEYCAIMTLHSRVVSNCIVQAMHGKPVTAYGNGLQTRT